MQIVFFGTAEFAVPSLECLVARHKVLTCVTQPDRPQGRGLVRVASPVTHAAVRFGIPVAQPERLHVDLLAKLQPELGVVAAYGQVIPADVLRLPAFGMLGLHPSLLPRYRGSAPVAWALLNGEATTGVTVFRLTARVDAGDVLLQETLAVHPDDTTETLTGRLARLGAQVLTRAIEAVASGQARFVPQDETQASAAPKLTKAHGRIEWGAPAEAIERLVRAMTPWPGAATEWRETPLKIWKASIREEPARHRSPGEVIRITRECLTVATGRGAVDIAVLQPAGRRRMRVQEFLAGHPMQNGDRLGT